MTQEVNLIKKLKHCFGFDKFKGDQEAIIRNLFDRHDTFVLMPVGGGESLCCQFPSLIIEGAAIVVSPLIALMKNQVDVVNRVSEEDGIAHHLDSSLKKAEIDQVRINIVSGRTKLLYVTPESLGKEEDMEFLRSIKISLCTIDETHCISEWGRDLRPEYRKIRCAVEATGTVPVIALTATTTDKVRTDIVCSLGIENYVELKSFFNHPNLHCKVRSKKSGDDTDKQVIKSIEQHTNKSDIICYLSCKKVGELATVLQANDIKAAPYHVGLDSGTRSKTQDDFLMEGSDIIVTTIAFDMSIDKPDVRSVMYYDIPRSLEGYYQKTGRTGRDGEERVCIVFYSKEDLNKLEESMGGKPVTEQDIGRQLLQEIRAYTESSICHREMLLHYFGEDYPRCNCIICDGCPHPKTKIGAQRQLLIILQAAKTLEENFCQECVIDFVRGRAANDQKDYKHNGLGDFGEDEDENPKIWSPVVRQTLLAGYPKKDIENYGLLKLAATGKRFLKSPESSTIVVDTGFRKENEDDELIMGTAVLDPELFSMLKNLHKRIAHKLEAPPYIIFQDVPLEQIAVMYPTSKQELQSIRNAGIGKTRRYGRESCELIKWHCEGNSIERLEELRVRAVAEKSTQRVKTVQSIDRKLPLDDIVTAEGLDFDDLLARTEEIAYSGTKLNIDYSLEGMYDEGQVDDICDYFMDSETNSLDAMMEELDSDYSEEEIRLVRIRFLLKMAN